VKSLRFWKEGSVVDREALMDGDNAHADASPPHPKLKFAITASSTLFALKNTKGRGFQQDSDFAANRTSRLTGSESKKVMDLRFERR
jgi:hypothetical protein